MRRLLFILLLASPAPALSQADADNVSRDDVVEATLAAIESRLPGASSRLEVSVVRMTASSDNGSPPSVKLPDTPLVPKGRIQVSVSNGEERFWAVVHVAHFDSVAVLPASLGGGDPVLPEDLRFVWIDVTRFSGEPLTRRTLSAWGSQELVARRSLRADRSLRVTDIGPRPAAETGEPVRMTYRRAGFSLELSCRARDRGQVGDVIRLYSDDSDIVYRARLTAPGRADWLETFQR